MSAGHQTPFGGTPSGGTPSGPITTSENGYYNFHDYEGKTANGDFLFYFR